MKDCCSPYLVARVHVHALAVAMIYPAVFSVVLLDRLGKTVVAQNQRVEFGAR